MRLETNHIIVRDFERKDSENLYKIVREKSILRFMPDWAGNRNTPGDYFRYIDWHQTQKDSIDVYENKRYAIALPDTDTSIYIFIYLSFGIIGYLTNKFMIKGKSSENK